jgi:hypothetical protein
LVRNARAGRDTEGDRGQAQTAKSRRRSARATWRERFGALALDISPASVDDMRALIDSEMRRWKEVVAQTNIRLEQ